MRNGVQLITYADRFGEGDLTTLRDLLVGPLDGVLTGVHVLPFYRPFDGADAGFDPIDHLAVDRRLGNWADIRAIAETHDVTADLIVNHVSDESAEFLDFLANGERSDHSGMFLEFDSVFPTGATASEILAIYRPRPQLPFTVVTHSDGSRRIMWTTFTPHQIDLDVTDPGAQEYLGSVLDRLALAGVSQVRLDAIGYAVKTPGTTCFMTPETHRFIDDIAGGVRRRGMESLLEIHSHHSEQRVAAGLADRVYDFALSPLILHSLFTGSARPLAQWLAESPRNAISVLDTHDGIGIVDVAARGDRPGLLGPGEIDELVEGIHRACNGESRLATGAAASNVDLYQVNCTYFSALGGDEDRYLLARLAQFLAPGIPQVYYGGLVAAENDMPLLAKTGVGRDINRPYLSKDEVLSALDRPVVRRLMAMARFRNRHPAFAGSFRVEERAPSKVALVREVADATVDAVLDFDSAEFRLAHHVEGHTEVIDDWGGF